MKFLGKESEKEKERIKNMNTIDQYTFMNVLGFLQPRELCRIRRLNKWMNRECDGWLTRQIGKTCLESLACPKCGDFIENIQESEREINHSYYYDILYDMSPNRPDHRREKMNSFLRGMFYMCHYFREPDSIFNKPEVKRCQLLCDECETIEDDQIINLEERREWNWRGGREYAVCQLYDTVMNVKWAVVIRYNRNTIRWNEYRCFLSEEQDEYPEYQEYYPVYSNQQEYHVYTNRLDN